MDTPELRGQEWHKEVFATIAAFAPLRDATPKSWASMLEDLCENERK